LWITAKVLSVYLFLVVQNHISIFFYIHALDY